MIDFDPKTYDPKTFDPAKIWGGDPLAMQSIAEGEEELKRNTIPFEALDPKYKNLGRKFLVGCNIALMGDAQNGKTTTARQLCARYKFPYEEIPCSPSTKKADLIGRKTIGQNGQLEFELGPLGRCFVYGKVAILSEGNTMTADQTTTMLPYFDGTPTISEGDMVLKRHPMFRVISTGNPLYIGSKPQNPAYMSRFGTKIRVGRWPESVFKKVGLSKWPQMTQQADFFGEANRLCLAVEKYAAENGGIISVGIREITDLMETLLFDSKLVSRDEFEDMVQSTIVGGLADQKIPNELIDGFLKTDIQKGRVDTMYLEYTKAIAPASAQQQKQQTTQPTGKHGKNAFDDIFDRRGMGS